MYRVYRVVSTCLDRGIGIRVDPIIADVSMVPTSVSTWYRARLRMSDNGSAETT